MCEPNSFTNRSTTYILWDGQFIYIAVEYWDNDLIARTKAYTQNPNSNGDINPYYNDCAEIWYNFESGSAPTWDNHMRKIGYDAYGVADNPFSSESEGLYSEWFLNCDAAAATTPDYDPAAEDGFTDRAVLEFKIPAKTEGGNSLIADNYIYLSVQINDISEATDDELLEKGFDPESFEPDPLASGIASGYVHYWTRARAQYPSGSKMNGYRKATLTEVEPILDDAE